ncbi:MAG: DUF4998 domain-containing protein [Bacteroidia bacterium]|nr:DUF4998 domain-containing protein [Bacteroidia bacterium]
MNTKYKILFLSIFVSVFYIGCDDMNSIHQEYLDMPEVNYIGMPTDIEAYPGYERVKITWKINEDPKIATTRIYWNNRQDSVIHNITRNDTIETAIIDNLPGGSYNFELVQYSQDGKNKSLKGEVSSRTFGTDYINQLSPQPLTINTQFSGDIILTWSSVEGGLGTSFTYTAKDGTSKTVEVEPDQTSTVLTDADPEGDYSYATRFLPEENAIDEVQTNPVTGTFQVPDSFIITKSDWDNTYKTLFNQLPRNTWTATASTEERGGEGPVNGYVRTILDGDFGTFWHSQWSVAPPPLPHTIVVDAQEAVTFSAIELARRRNNRDTGICVLSMSNDNTTWTTIGTLVYGTDVNQNSQVFAYPQGVSKTARYFKIEITEVNNTGRHASISEFILFNLK